VIARLISRGDHDWAQGFPLIIQGALRLRQKYFTIDGEVVVLDKNGISNFDALALRRHDKRAQFYGFDMLAGEDADICQLPLWSRKTSPHSYSRGRSMASSSPNTSNATGQELFRAACKDGA
jgi:bifunctional non-homologous end joining protein LigD